METKNHHANNKNIGGCTTTTTSSSRPTTTADSSSSRTTTASSVAAAAAAVGNGRVHVAGILHLPTATAAAAVAVCNHRGKNNKVNHDDDDDNDSDSLRQSILKSALHDRQRRVERGVCKTDLQRARRYGLAEHQNHHHHGDHRKNGRIKYTLGGQVFVYEPRSNTAVTCWKLPSSHAAPCASAHTNPILLTKHNLSQHDHWQHENTKSLLRTRHDLITSHTVIVVDFSGSMRRDDVPGARCRSDAVFLTLCRDFVQPQILLQQEQNQQQQHHQQQQHQNQQSSSSSNGTTTETPKNQADPQEEAFDVVSIIVMKDQTQHVLLQAEPLDWVLYNTLIDLRENAFNDDVNLKPRGHGCYLPALDMAEDLLWMMHHQDSQQPDTTSCSSNTANSTIRPASRISTTTATAAGNMGDGGCALSLLFFSDGKPSDPHVYKNGHNNNNNKNQHHHQQQQYQHYRDGSYQAIANRVGKIAARLGRRLTLGCIAMAGSSSSQTDNTTACRTSDDDDDDDDDFVALQHMVREAQAHGSIASFHQPRVLHSESLSHIMSTLVTSITSAKTELSRTTSRITRSSSKRNHHHQRLSVRTDIIRERSNHWGCLSGTATAKQRELDANKDEYLSQEWRVFRDPLPGQPQLHQLQYTVNVWTWNCTRNDWVYLMDPRCQHCFACVADENFSTTSLSSSSSSSSPFSTNNNQVPGRQCLGCQACYFCWDCIQRGFHLSHTATLTRPPTSSAAAGACRATTECQEYIRERRHGSILKRSIPSFSVAVKKTAFGEGAERVAFKFRYLDATGRFVGPKMVAKESRFVQDQYDYYDPSDQDDDRGNAGHAMLSSSTSSGKSRRAYHTQFLQTQAIASRFADLFNQALDDLVKLAPKRFRRQLKQYPRIRFVEPLVFELQEGSFNHTAAQAVAATSVINYLLIEPMIEGTYRKFNNNMGAVVDVRATETDQQKDQGQNSEENDQGNIISRAQEMMLMSRNDLHSSSTGSGSDSSSNSQLNVIQEGPESSCIAEDEDDAHDDKADSSNQAVGAGEHVAKSTSASNGSSEWCLDKDFLRLENGNSRISRPTGSFSNIHDGDFPQAFSHFTYVKSKKNIMVVDLQGALNVVASNGKREFVLTDPAIHKRRRDGTGTGLLRTINFGRTNRGHKGMQAFFETHCCNDVCRMLGLPEEEQAKPQQPATPPLPTAASSDSGVMSV